MPKLRLGTDFGEALVPKLELGNQNITRIQPELGNQNIRGSLDMKRTMRCFTAAGALLILAWGFPGVLRAAQDDLAEARRLLLSGKYAEAAEVFGRRAPENPAARLGLARSLAAEGKYEEAQRALTSGAG